MSDRSAGIVINLDKIDISELERRIFELEAEGSKESRTELYRVFRELRPRVFAVLSLGVRGILGRAHREGVEGFCVEWRGLGRGRGD